MISVAIPTYEMNGHGHFFMDISLGYMEKQTYKDFEVIISDHSNDDSIKKLLTKYEKNLNIKYIKNTKNVGNSSANINNAMVNCDGEIIKILFQDEFLYDKNCLYQINNSFDENNDNKWLLNGCCYGESTNNINGFMKPKYTDDVMKGYNTIGSPSTISILNKNKIFFDENILWLMDCDYYKRCYDILGDPIILDNPLIFVTQHENQLTNLIPQDIKEKENIYILNKHNIF